jgi:hypothetical protein
MVYEDKVKLYRKVFGGVDGKLVLEDLMAFCGIEEPSYNVDNVNETFLREGAKMVGLRILYYLKDKENKDG